MRNRRSKAIIGVATLAVLGTGAAAAITLRTDETVRQSAPLVTLDAESGVSSASISSSPVSSSLSSSRGEDTARPRSQEERIRRVRETAAKQTRPISHPLLPQAGGWQVPESELNATVDKDDHGELRRLYSSRHDLTGQKELAWVTDDHEKIGEVSCTQKIRLSRSVPAKERSTLLICWRVSAAKSVYTVAVKKDGRPSKERSVVAVNREWTKLT
ncbi:hypothetical protein OHA21_29955 [Actinoplanes sp. NBC_00393]|uniref:hypothetical protein n=1 Tax=Actinoplanes sp. NBC_00393 TaxID=2975953 RepID=UPI002E1F6D1F